MIGQTAGALPAHGVGFASTGPVSLGVMWFGMMAAMMTPTVWPWIVAFDRLGRDGRGPLERGVGVLSFSSGYLVAWLLYSVAAVLVQLSLQRSGALVDHKLASMFGTGVFLAAGLFQFAPVKRACLMHCRSPISYFLARWRNGPVSGFRMGLGHGVFCVGCCWALMATALAVGTMNLWWMAVLTVAVFAEQVLPQGDRVRRPLGVALIVAGLLPA